MMPRFKSFPGRLLLAGWRCIFGSDVAPDEDDSTWRRLRNRLRNLWEGLMKGLCRRGVSEKVGGYHDVAQLRSMLLSARLLAERSRTCILMPIDNLRFEEGWTTMLT